MPVFIHDIVSANPEMSFEQNLARDILKEKLGQNRKVRAILHAIYGYSGIEKRHTVLDDALDESPNSFFNRAFSDEVEGPTTEERNEVYTEASSKLFLEIGNKLLERNTSFSTSEITHVITVSCTGFYAPGPDFEIVKGLGLKPSTQRFHLGFMGCYAAFPALKMAEAFCKADPDATVMVICTELCTLHFQNKTDLDNLVAASVFADGSAGVLVSSKEPAGKGYQMDGFASSLAYEGEKDMAWTIGDTGFDMILSSYVPDIIESNLGGIITPLLNEFSITKKDVETWAIHPGGRAIIDKVVEAMQLKEEQVQSSRKVLANYGNMSSATVLFVLKDILSRCPENGSRVLPIAFGPGLTIESGLFRVVS
ncbi:MAG: type III polyketide synthase [Balneola sp.]|nr:MAG: type III polyketide synthase [Balneola sp.]